MPPYEFQGSFVSLAPPDICDGVAGIQSLPLNLLAMIISYIENVADLARICRTCRLLHFMAIPQLYRDITLTSYDSIRYRDDVPEGFGSSSPFTMGLNALVTRSVSNLVRSVTLQGRLKEDDLEEYLRVGRVPDSTMMLNIVIRAALDRCDQINHFAWKLNSRLLNNAYTGLSNLRNLHSFQIQFPSTRTPQPTVLVPEMPNLRSFTMTDYDPLCYPDDLSRMIFSATKLETLQLHFSPRMRNEGELSVSLANMFRHNIAAKRPLFLKKLGVYNLFAMFQPETMGIFVPSLVREITSINSFGASLGESSRGNGKSLSTYFVDRSWENKVPLDRESSNVLSWRDGRFGKDTIIEIAHAPKLERIYFVNARPPGQMPEPPEPPASSSSHTVSIESSPSGPGNRKSSYSRQDSLPRATSSQINAMRDAFIETLGSVHGPRLKHLIFPSRLPLSAYSIAQLLRGCPNLTQLSFAPEEINPETLRILMPFATKLWAFRMTPPEQSGVEGAERRKRFDSFEARTDHAYFLGLELAGRLGGSPDDFAGLKIFGVGNKVFEALGLYEEVVDTQDEDGNSIEVVALRKTIKELELKDVMNIEIWKMDTMEVH